jgi:hypothetical protein
MLDRQQNAAGRFSAGCITTEDLPSIRRLMLAVLQDALECLSNDATNAAGLNTRKRAQEAADWLTDMNEREVFSFKSVCEVLGLNAAAVRKVLIDSPTSGLRMPGRSPVVREPAKLSLTPHRERIPGMRRARSNGPSFKE